VSQVEESKSFKEKKNVPGISSGISAGWLCSGFSLSKAAPKKREASHKRAERVLRKKFFIASRVLRRVLGERTVSYTEKIRKKKRVAMKSKETL